VGFGLLAVCGGGRDEVDCKVRIRGMMGGLKRREVTGGGFVARDDTTSRPREGIIGEYRLDRNEGDSWSLTFRPVQSQSQNDLSPDPSAVRTTTP
jgi:hypothetical protein